MKRIVFCDIDGTLLNSKGGISEKSMLAINELESRCIPFVIVTARPPIALYPLLDSYNLRVDAITSNGSIIVNKNRNVLFENSMTKKEASYVVDFISNSNYDISLSIYSKSEWVGYGIGPDKRVEIEERIVNAKAIYGNLDTIKEELVCKLFCVGEKDDIYSLEMELNNRFHEFNIVKSNDFMIEITKKGVSKVSGVKEYAKINDVELKNCFAFGDSYSDIDMLNSVGYGYIMGNAKDDIKEKMKYIAKDNDNDGIYYALKEQNII